MGFWKNEELENETGGNSGHCVYLGDDVGKEIVQQCDGVSAFDVELPEG